jgi:heme exporter protein C
MYSSKLRTLTLATVITLTGAFILAALYAPIEADQGFSQKIFYVHVPLAIVSLGGFVFGGIEGLRYLRTRDPKHDLRSYTAIHISVILGIGVLITGAIWAKVSWDVWFEWREATLVSFLIVFLLYCTYQPLRFSIIDPEQQSRYAAVFAVTAGAFVPLNFLAVRLANPYIHPRVLNNLEGGALPGQMKVVFYLALVGMTLLFVTLWKLEMTHKLTRGRVKGLERRLDRLRGDTDDGGMPARSAAPQVVA